MKVSVVVPTRNRARLVGTAVASALAQTLEDIEVVVVDDGSTDATPDLLANLARSDSRVRTIRNEQPAGAAAARNTGARHARAGTLAFLDDDCVWAPDKLERQLPRIGPGRGVAYCRQAIRDPGGVWVVEGGPEAEGDALGALLRGTNIATPTLVVRREVFREAGGFDEDLPRLQDLDIALRLARHTAFAFEPGVLVQGVQVEGISLQSEALRAAVDRMLEGHAPFLDRAQRARLAYRLGKFLLVDGMTSPARKTMLGAVRAAPWLPLGWIGVAAALAGPAPARLVRSIRLRARAADAGLTDARGPDLAATVAPSVDPPSTATPGIDSPAIDTDPEAH